MAYRLALVIVSAWALAMQFGISNGRVDLGMLAYVTTWNGAVVTVWAAAASGVTVRDLLRRGVVGWSTPSARGAGFVVLLCVVTMSMYFLVVAPTVDVSARFSPTSMATHVVVPVAMIGEWLLFTPKGKVRAIDPLLWLVPFAAYLAWVYVSFALGNGLRGHAFPYSFLDLEANGVLPVVIAVALVGGAIVATGFVLWVLDSVLGRCHREPSVLSPRLMGSSRSNPSRRRVQQ